MSTVNGSGSMFQNGSSGSSSANGGSGAGGNVPWGGPFPSLHLWPVHDTFQMKMIHLPEGQRIKIGRQTNNKTIPGERNAYFDSKVLSRTHAEIWEHGGRMYIKDLKSSNGTFINGERLSAEGVESDPFQLKSQDMVEFGIDIVSEDNRSIVHHKVATKIYCVFDSEEAAESARNLVNYQSHDPRGMRRQNGATGQLGSIGQSGPIVMSSGGKINGLTFDHVVHKLQTELQKSKETGSALQDLATAMGDIQDTLGGGMPPAQNGSAERYIPPQYRNASPEAQAALAGPHGQQAAAFISLQNQLTETQTSLNGHLEKIRDLESQLRDHETVKSDVTHLREQMEEGQKEMQDRLATLLGDRANGDWPEDAHDDDDDDDARSVSTLMGNEDGTQRAKPRALGAKGSRDSLLERPATPEPGANGDMSDGKSHGDHKTRNSELEARLQTLTNEVTEAVQLSQTLQTQHGEAMSAVKQLSERVGALENGIQSKVAEEVTKAEQRWETWRVKFEEGWRRERESWNAERERLRGVVREWEESSRRAHEEEEDRELNESLSESDDEDDIEDDEDVITAGGDGENSLLNIPLSGWKPGDPNPGLDVNGLPLRTFGPSPSPSSSSIPPVSPSRAKNGSRRRRPSQRASLAVSALKAVAGDIPISAIGEAGASTPRAEITNLSPDGTSGQGGNDDRLSKLRGMKGNNGGRKSLSRSGSNSTFKARRKGGGVSPSGAENGSRAVKGRESNSSESGKESGDTLTKESDESGSKRRGGKKSKVVDTPNSGVQIPLFTVIFVAVVAGAIYYKQKD